MSLLMFSWRESVSGSRLGVLAALLTLGGAGCQEPSSEPETPSTAVTRQAPRVLATQKLVTELTSEGQEVVSGELLVRFRSDNKVSAARIHGAMGAQVVRTYQSISGLQRVSLPPGVGVELAAEAYRADPDVLYAEPNYLYSIDRTPDDPEFDELWGMHNIGQSSGTADADLNMPDAWELTTGSEEAIIAVIDTGINYLHEDLADNMWTNPGEIPDNDVDDDGNGYVDDVHGINAITGSGDPLDDNKHGSHCAGTIAGRGNNAKGVTGVNWQAKLIACKFLSATGSGATADAVECLDYLHTLRTRTSHPVNIVASSNSWGGGSFSQALQDAIAKHQEAGILFIAAAGNNSANNDVTNNYPSNYPLVNIIAVAAIDRKDALASFSSYGRRRVHVGAPGVDVLSSVLGQDYALLSGTSMATPHVSGLVGLLKAQDPTRDWRALKNLIMAGGVDSAALAGKTITGRRIRAADVGGKGSLTCDNQVLTSQVSPFINSLQVLRGGSVDIAAHHINCANPAGPLALNVTPGGGTVSLADDGKGMDQVAGDGLYFAQWRPPGAGTYTLTYPSAETLTVTAMDVYRPAEVVPFAWRTITGTSLNLADNAVVQVTTPFPVRYGNHLGFSDAWVSAEGYLSFTDSRSSSSNVKPPTTNWGTLVAVLWDNFHTNAAPPGHVYHEVLGTAPNREWVIEWREIGNYLRRADVPYPTATFQVVFKENSSEVLFNYQDVNFKDGTDANDRGGSATVGLQVISSAATVFSHNTKSLNDKTSLLFRTNAPPVVDVLAAASATVAEGGSLDFTATFSDADGAVDADWVAEFDFDYVGTTFTVDNTQTFTAEGTITASRAFSQSGRYIVGLRVKDKDGATSAVRTLVVNVENVAPVAAVPTASPGSTSEGKSVRLEASFSDVGVSDNPWKVEWDFDYDGREFKPDHAQSVTAQGPILLDRVFRRDGTFTVAMRVVDKDSGASSLKTTTVTISDVKPALSALSAATTVEEGAGYSLATAFTDPGDGASPWVVQFDLNYDGTTFDVDREKTYAASGNVTLDNVFDEDGARVIAARIVDADGSVSAVRTVELDVLDPSPIIREAVATSLTGNEPRTVEFRLAAVSGSPTASMDPVRYYAWDFDGDGAVDHVSSDPRTVFRYLDNPKAGDTWQATVWVEDEDSRTAHTFPIEVKNAPPVLATVASTHAATAGEAFQLQLSATDPAGGNDPLTWRLTNAPTGMTVSSSGLVQWMPVSAQAADGGKPHTFTVTVSDDDGAEVTRTFTINVSYNPTNGAPGAPVAVSPSASAAIYDGKPALIVINAKDPDGDVLTYEFEVYADAISGQMVASASAVASGENATRFQVSEALKAGTYTWRARAMDSRGAQGPWSEVVAFQVTRDGGGCSSAGGISGGLLPLLLVALGLRRRRP
ncbi:S8 family peptidase [Archangium sp.]|uniref:S8 family peptidase n=1 Tax=Archangium sp. TaxID=1872627 RepID=UPI002D397DD3|nr:S8 family serine peptidase [Archangium sp.]HYO56956.1 S8 family serine peptidase [Archangium sp.]